MGSFEVCSGCNMHTYGHINKSKMLKYQSAATNMKVSNIVLHSIKTIIKYNINGETRINKKVRYNYGFNDFRVILIISVVFVSATIILN